MEKKNDSSNTAPQINGLALIRSAVPILATYVGKGAFTQARQEMIAFSHVAVDYAAEYAKIRLHRMDMESAVKARALTERAEAKIAKKIFGNKEKLIARAEAKEEKFLRKQLAKNRMENEKFERNFFSSAMKKHADAMYGAIEAKNRTEIKQLKQDTKQLLSKIYHNPFALPPFLWNPGGDTVAKLAYDGAKWAVRTLFSEAKYLLKNRDGVVVKKETPEEKAAKYILHDKPNDTVFQKICNRLCCNWDYDKHGKVYKTRILSRYSRKYQPK